MRVHVKNPNKLFNQILDYPSTQDMSIRKTQKFILYKENNFIHLK